MTDLHTSITTSISHLDWCTAIPHTIDQVAGLAIEAISADHANGPALPVRHGATLDEIVAAWNARRGDGSTGYANPTASTVSTSDDLGSLDAAVALIAGAAQAIDDRTADALGHERWHPRLLDPSRAGRLRHATAQLHHAHPHVGQASLQDRELVMLVRTELGDTATWLHDKTLAIWKASRGDTKPVAVQRSLAECNRCSSWRKGTIAVRNGACAQCLKFNQHHRCWPTEAIVRRWDYGQGATPGQILEARATSRRKAKAS